MAANKFATTVNKNTHKLVLLLVYALLEWVLISLLLLNSVFSYLIAKFASYFGLQKPCLWCSRVDHIFENKPNKYSYTELLCESHASEISRLGFCSNHKRLAESKSMCWDCSVSQPRINDDDDDEDRNEDKNHYSRCRCCDERFRREDVLMDPYLILSPSWGVSEIARIGNLGEDKRLNLVTSVNGYEHDEFGCLNSGDVLEEDEEDCLSSSSMFICYEKEAMECSKTGSLDGSGGELVRQILHSDASIVQCHSKEDDLVEDIIESSCRYSQSVCDHRLVPVELIDLSTITESRIESQLNMLEINENIVDKETNNSQVEDLEMVMSFGDQTSVTESEEKQKDLHSKASEQLLTTKEVHALQINVKKALMTKLNDLPGSECELAHKDFSSSNDTERDVERRETMPFEKLPETPTSTASERREASLASEVENAESVWTVEQLRSALRSERKALSALYAELEEERNASAVAAKETMAMITRLQEEKAAVQMEAVQYQRMMEEQSEYDQEALQLLNDLMVKREREKIELERELGEYRKIVLDHGEPERERSGRGSEEMAGSVGIVNESLTEFEEERLSILGQLRALEERLVESDESSQRENGNESLSFLDGADSENEEKAESLSDSGKNAIEEEVDRVYERLQALEADREFLKNCMNSLKKGDKGMDLLQEILQHLRDLRTVELRMSISNDEDLGE